MPVKISVFNYLSTSLPVRINLESSAEFELLPEEGTVAAADQVSAGTFSVCIPQGDKETVSVRLRPLMVGDVNLAVSASVDGSIAGCTSESSLPVKQ